MVEEGSQKELIAKLRKEIAALKREKDDAKHKQAITNDRLMEVKRERGELSKEVQDMGARLKQSESQREMLETKVARFCLEIEERITRLEQSEQEVDGAEVQPADDATRQLEEQLRDREERLRAAAEENSTLEQELEAARKQLDRLEKEVDATNQAVDAAIERGEGSTKKENVGQRIVRERELVGTEIEGFGAAFHVPSAEFPMTFQGSGRCGEAEPRMVKAEEDTANSALLELEQLVFAQGCQSAQHDDHRLTQLQNVQRFPSRPKPVLRQTETTAAKQLPTWKPVRAPQLFASDDEETTVDSVDCLVSDEATTKCLDQSDRTAPITPNQRKEETVRKSPAQVVTPLKVKPPAMNDEDGPSRPHSGPSAAWRRSLVIVM